MSLVGFLNQNVFFTTQSFARGTSVAIETASRQLKRLSQKGEISPVVRGVWAQMQHPYFSPYGAVPFILGNEHGYVSFLTALHLQGAISQIPRVIQIATTGHGRRVSSIIGDFELFHIHPSLMRDGIEHHEGRLAYNMATLEKALIDTLHISTRKGRRFSKFPEFDLSVINKKKLKSLLASLKLETRRRVESRLNSLIL